MKEKKIVARVIIEIVGAPKEHVEKTLDDVLEKFKNEEKIKMITSKLFESKELKNKFWSAFAEIEFRTETMKDLLNVCFDYTPSALEILEPAGIELDTQVVANLFNDLLAKMHQLVAVMKNFEADNKVLKIQLDKLNKQNISKD